MKKLLLKSVGIVAFGAILFINTQFFGTGQASNLSLSEIKLVASAYGEDSGNNWEYKVDTYMYEPRHELKLVNGLPVWEVTFVKVHVVDCIIGWSTC